MTPWMVVAASSVVALLAGYLTGRMRTQRAIKDGRVKLWYEEGRGWTADGIVYVDRGPRWRKGQRPKQPSAPSDLARQRARFTLGLLELIVPPRVRNEEIGDA